LDIVICGLCLENIRDFLIAERGEKRMEKKVLSAMKKAGKPVRPGDVAKMIGQESKEVSKVMSELKKKGKVMSPKRCYYALSK
jgi:Mn-dependent DtxR family transcriptional regulator